MLKAENKRLLFEIDCLRTKLQEAIVVHQEPINQPTNIINNDLTDKIQTLNAFIETVKNHTANLTKELDAKEQKLYDANLKNDCLERQCKEYELKLEEIREQSMHMEVENFMIYLDIDNSNKQHSEIAKLSKEMEQLRSSLAEKVTAHSALTDRNQKIRILAKKYCSMYTNLK